MSKTLDWAIEVFESGSTYVSDGYIQRPNEDLQMSRVSTMQKVKLADGSNGFITPETKYIKEPLSMFFADVTSAFITQLEGYITDGDKVRITTHTGIIFTGRFISYTRVWFTGIEESYDINVTFEQME